MPAVLIKLISQNFDGFVLSSLSGLVIGIILAVFLLVGKHPVLRYSL